MLLTACDQAHHHDHADGSHDHGDHSHNHGDHDHAVSKNPPHGAEGHVCSVHGGEDQLKQAEIVGLLSIANANLLVLSHQAMHQELSTADLSLMVSQGSVPSILEVSFAGMAADKWHMNSAGYFHGHLPLAQPVPSELTLKVLYRDEDGQEHSGSLAIPVANKKP